MLNIHLAYRPEPSENIPRETELSRALAREFPNEKLVTWKNGEGQWVVSLIEKDGMWFDVAMAGSKDQPSFTRGHIDSIKSMCTARELGKGPLAQMRAHEAVRRAKYQQKQDEWDERLRYYRKKMGGDAHPILDQPRLRK